LGIFLFKGCSSPQVIYKTSPPPPPKIVLKPYGVPVKDSTPYAVPVYIRDSFGFAVPAPVTLSKEDTLEIIRRGLTTYYYEDSINDDRVKIGVADSIRGSKITYRRVGYELLKPETTVYMDTLSRFAFYLGPSLGVSDSARAHVGIDLMLMDSKNGSAFRITPAFPASIEFAYLRKISFRKKK
jgi:hypothetical protein